MTEHARTRPSTVAALCLTELVCVSAMIGPVLAGLALRVEDIRGGFEPESALSLVVGAGALTTILANPVFGWLGDRTAARTGSRASWVLGGAIVGLVAMIGIVVADTLSTVVIAWVVAHAGYNATVVNLYGELPDVVAEEDRPRVSAWFAASGAGAIVLGALALVLLPKSMPALFGVLPVIALAVAGVAAAHLRSVPRTGALAGRGGRPGDRHETPATAEPGFWRLWTQRLLGQTAWTFTALYGVHVLTRRAGIEKEHAAAVVGAAGATSAALAAVAAVVVAPRLVRAFGYRAVLCAGMGTVVLVNIAMSLTTTTTGYAVALVAVGFGVGLYTAPDLALALRLLPGGREGRYLGFFGAARSLPQALVPAVAPLLFAVGTGDRVGLDTTQNFTAYFLGGAVVAALAVAAVPGVPVPARGSSTLDLREHSR